MPSQRFTIQGADVEIRPRTPDILLNPKKTSYRRSSVLLMCRIAGCGYAAPGSPAANNRVPALRKIKQIFFGRSPIEPIAQGV
jgi:hypothetical protein